MSILSPLRDRLTTRKSSASDPTGDAGASGEPAPPPLPGYERLDAGQVVHGLSDHSQVELKAVESYERSHQNREPVLDKLRWLRGHEPLPGYDNLDIEAVLAALEDADLATVKKVRGYERKFANRRDVLEAVTRARHRHQGSEDQRSEPANAGTTYQPLSASATAAGSANSSSEPRARP